jgi:ElaB/YqjD/DUF883 family membrane-anchored ribosome-binding protein
MSANTEQLRHLLAKIVEDIEGLAAAADTAKAADRYVRDHAWVSIGVAAAIAFLLGALSTRRDRP